MPKSKLAKNNISASTQKYLDIAEIRDGVVIMKDGSIRKVLMASSINFALKSEDEQEAIIQGYLSFLNSIDFPLQIIIQSRKLNIDKYLSELSVKEKEQTNELLKTQIFEYKKFISELVSLGNIMGKKFYIVVPYSPKGDIRKGFMEQIGYVFNPMKTILLSKNIFNQYKEKLETRVNKVADSLSSIGITAIPLETHSLVELYYSSYNIDLSQLQKLPGEDKMNFNE